MSHDTVDALHAAEDRAGTLAHALAAVLDAWTAFVEDSDDVDFDALAATIGTARAVLDAGYCRCECADDDHEPDEFDTCGCPCHNELDTTSSASRQHYIDTGRYLTNAETAEAER